MAARQTKKATGGIIEKKKVGGGLEKVAAKRYGGGAENPKPSSAGKAPGSEQAAVRKDVGKREHFKKGGAVEGQYAEGGVVAPRSTATKRKARGGGIVRKASGGPLSTAANLKDASTNYTGCDIKD